MHAWSQAFFKEIYKLLHGNLLTDVCELQTLYDTDSDDTDVLPALATQHPSPFWPAVLASRWVRRLT